MTGTAVLYRNEFISKTTSARASAVPIQQAWAAYVRNRWPKNALCEIQCEWDLSEGEARNLLYAHGSLRTIDKIGRHRNGGLRLELDLLLFRWRTSLEDYAQTVEQEREHARLREEARQQSERLALSRLAGLEDQAEAVAAPPGGAP